MATITVRSVKGSPLTQAEVDQNFINLNTDKLDTSGLALGSAASPSLKFTGDANTGIYSPGADQVAVATNGTQSLLVDAVGNVIVSRGNLTLNAIGGEGGQLILSNPTNTATVYNLDADSATHARLFTTNNNTDLQIGQLQGTGGNIQFVTESAERLSITSAGLVGIGTSAPVATLDVGGSTATTNSGLSNVNFFAGFTGSTFGGVLAGAGVTGNTPFIAASRNGAGTGLPLTFHTTGAERIRIDSSGRLLVGTSSDSGGALLQVNGDRIRVGTAKTPATSGATGTTGEIAWDADYIYVCTATNTWKRSAIATW